jgi:TonB family protein
MSNYLIELSVIHTALILGYWFFLKKERQYAKMRFYLIGSTLLAVTIPLLKLPKLFFNSKDPIVAMPMEPISLDAMAIAPAADASGWSYDFLIWTYGAISAVFLFKFLSSLYYLICLERKSSYEKFNEVYIRKVPDIKGSFTFFKWIFLSNDIDTTQQEYAVILKHEQAHASLGHTYDVMLFELFKVFFWWLPTAWFMIKEIKKIHEYQADACALKSCNVEQYSSILISSTLKTNGLSLASSFHGGLILKRLKAMKQKTKNVRPWKLWALSALSASLFIAFACSEEPGKQSTGFGSESDKQGKIFTVVEAQPEFEGGLDAFHRYVLNEIKYPVEARKKGVEGRVDVEFVVGKDGSVSDVKAINGIGAGCDDEAVRVLQNAPKFKPGTQNGKPVFVRMVLPITFALDPQKTNPDNSSQGIIVLEEIESINETLKIDASYANGEWSGTVYDENGEGLPGANIVVVGTTNGTSSDLDGNFKLKASESSHLNVSFIGYESVRLEKK